MADDIAPVRQSPPISILIDELVPMVVGNGRQHFLPPDVYARMMELDALIKRGCQVLGIEIPLIEDLKSDRFRFGFTGIPYQMRTRGGIIVSPTINWEQAMRGLRYIAADVASDVAVKATQDEAASANRLKLFPKGVPENNDIVDLVVRLDAERDSGKSMNRIEREYTKEKRGKDQRAKSLLAQVRRLKRQGRVNL